MHQQLLDPIWLKKILQILNASFQIIGVVKHQLVTKCKCILSLLYTILNIYYTIRENH